MSLQFAPPDGDWIVDPTLKEWATDVQARNIDAINEHGSMRAAGEALGVAHSAISRSMVALRAKAASKGYAPGHDMRHPVPDPFVVKGTSTLYGPDGQVKLQWSKTRIDDEARAVLLREAYEAMADDLPRLEPAPAPDATTENLCNVYTLTDCHIGMLAWRKEGGADWDVKIAERMLVGGFEQMVVSSPPARTCVVNQLGDWMHSDGLLPVTPTSGHVLDQDGRFSKMVSAAIRVLRRVIDFALTRHEQVVVVVAEGNHDMASSVWLRLMFAALYENEPRVRVIDSELPYYVHQHGEVMLAFHHGHLKKNDQLPLLFAAQYPRIWGETTKRYAHTGHRHHEEIKEHSGMKVTQHSTLAARDAYAARGGWLSERQCTAYTYHSRHGQVGSVTICPEMLEPAA